MGRPWCLAARAASADAAMAAVAAPGQDENTAVDMLREDAEQAEAEATLCLDRERMLALEVSELQRQRDEFRKQLEAGAYTRPHLFST